MTRHALRGLVLFVPLGLFAASEARAQDAPDRVTVRNPKDGTTRTFDGQLTVSAAGFQVVAGKKVAATFHPDDVVKVAIGDLPGVDRGQMLATVAKEEKRDWDGARAGYEDLLKKAPAGQDRTKRYLTFKKALMAHRAVDELDYEKGWKERSDAMAKTWADFLLDPKTTWEVWPAVRAVSRVYTERGEFAEAARTWARVAKNAELPPDARAEAALQEIDFQIRAKQYAPALAATGELLKSAVGTQKERLTIYQLAARAGSDNKLPEGVEQIKAEMNKSKDATTHATGYSLMGELYAAAGKPRDAMWSFLWVETVLNQDREEVFKAVARLAALFEQQADEDQVKKYRDKLKRHRTSF